MTEITEARSLFAELKRRKVYRTTAAYGAAVFAVWQAADIAFPALGLPPSLLRFVVVAALLGFPVAVGLSWAFEVVPERASAPSPVRLLARRPVFLTGALVLAVGSVAWTARPDGAAARGNGTSVLVADLRNETGDTLFDDVLDGALALSLAQSPHTHLLSAPQIRRGLQEMRRPESAPLNEATALELAQRVAVSVVVLPSLRRVGSRYLLTARLVDPSTEEDLVSRGETASGEDDILAALDRLARQLRSDLGETLASMVRTPMRLDQATTSSVQALRAWTMANREASVGRDDQAGLLYMRAVELDSTFAMAQSDLGQWYYWNTNDPARGDSAFERALANLEGVTERERLLIQGNVAEWRGDRPAAAAAFAAVTALLPHDVGAWGELAYINLRMGRDEEAIRAYERVLSLDSLDAHAWVNLATIRYGLGELEAAVALYERGFRLQPAMRRNPVLNEEYGHDLVLLGRFEAADSLYALLLDGTPTERARALRSMALLRTFRGRFEEAASLLRQSVVLHQTNGASISELRDRSFLAAAYLRLRRVAEAWSEVAAAVDLGVRNRIPPFLLGVVGSLAARTGRPEAAAVMLDSAIARFNGSPEERGSIEHLRGMIALEDGSNAEAITHLETAAALQAAGQGRWVRTLVALAQARWANGETDAALDLLEESAAATGASTSRENQDDWIMANLWLARLYEEQGRRVEAGTAYARLIERWGDAEPEPPEVSEARAYLREIALRS